MYRVDRMLKTGNARALVWSVVASGIVNSFLLSSAVVGGAESIYVKVADAIAAPPGFISNWLFVPKEHSTNAFVAGALGSLIFSFLFYAVISYALIYAVQLLRSVGNNVA
jgi:hypothetical protein